MRIASRAAAGAQSGKQPRIGAQAMMHSGPPPHVQLPPVHPSDVPESQLRPQAPQLLSSLDVLMHVPLQHDCAPEQVRPHAPQFATVSSVTQVPLQHIRPAVQAGPAPQPPPATQLPATQVWPAAHARPHIPQCSALVLTSTQPPPQQLAVAAHEPLAPQRHAVPMQVSPGRHAGVQADAVQVPATHVSPAAQACPHDPQCAALVCVSMHPPPQQLCGAVQATPDPQRHALAVHVLPVGVHARPHPPQSLAVLVVSMHAPPQHIRPAMHVPPAQAIWQRPPRQTVPAGQVIAQPPLPESGSTPVSSEPPPSRGPESRTSPPTSRRPASAVPPPPPRAQPLAATAATRRTAEGTRNRASTKGKRIRPSRAGGPARSRSVQDAGGSRRAAARATRP